MNILRFALMWQLEKMPFTTITDNESHFARAVSPPIKQTRYSLCPIGLVFVTLEKLLMRSVLHTALL